jgi:CDP-diacylglycerol--glycerol-3-phosphate 3-phosphatidyltransferase
MIARDVMVDALRMYGASQKKVMAANIFGKLKTIFQMIAIIIIFFLFNSTNTDKHINYYLLQNIVMYLALMFSIASGFIYFVNFYKKAGSTTHK